MSGLFLYKKSVICKAQVNFWYSGYDIIELKGIFENILILLFFGGKRDAGE